MRLLFILIFFFLFNSLFAQKINASISAEIEGNKVTEDLRKIGDEFIGLESDWDKTSRSPFGKVKDGYSIKLKKFDANMILIKETDLENGEKTFSVNKPILFTTNNRLFLVYCKKENDKLKIFSSPIDLANLTLGTPAELLIVEDFSINRFGGTPVDFQLFRNWLQIIKSPDQNKLLFFWNNQQQKQIVYAVTDNNFQFIRKGKEEIPEIKNTSVNNAMITDDGAVLVSLVTKKDNAGILFKNTKDNKSSFITIASPSEIEIEQLFVNPGGSNKITITGTYKEPKTKNIKGVFFSSQANLETVWLKKIAIPQSIVDKLSKIDFAEKKEKNYGISEISLQSLSLSDGAVALVGQFEGSIWGGQNNLLCILKYSIHLLG